MQLIRLPSPLVIFCLSVIGLSLPCQAELSANDTRALFNLKQACSSHQHQIEALLSKPGALSQQAPPLLESPVLLNASYWTIRDRSLKLPVQDVTTARDFSAIDGKLDQVESACSGHQDMQAWKSLAEMTIRGGKIDLKARDRLISSWKKSTRKRIAGNLSYLDYTKIMDTAYSLAQHRLLALTQASISARRAIDDQMRETAAKAKLVPALGNLSDPKWIEWSKYVQKRGIKERQLMVSAKKSLETLIK